MISQINPFITAVIGIFTIFVISTKGALVWGPLCGNVKNTEITIACKTDVSSTMVVEYGPDSSSLSNSAEELSAAISHKVTLKGLTPGMCYYYRVKDGDAVSRIGTFKTPAPDQDHFRFLFFGDNRGQRIYHRQICDRMALEPDIDFVLNGGDLTNKDDEWPTFFQHEENLLLMAPYIPTSGNHGSIEKQEEYFALPDPYGDKPYPNRFSYGRAFFHCGGNALYNLDTYLGDTLALLRQNHDRFYTLCHYDFVKGDGPESYGWAKPAADFVSEHDFDFVLFAHHHTFGHLQYQDTDYIKSGGGGAGLSRLNGNHSYGLEELRIFHYCLFDVRGDTTDLTVKDMDGNIMYTYRKITGSVPVFPQKFNPASQSGQIQCNPNPFTGMMQIRMNAQDGFLRQRRVNIYNVKGTLVRSLALKNRSTKLTWDGNDQEGIPALPGMYFVRARTGQGEQAVSVIRTSR